MKLAYYDYVWGIKQTIKMKKLLLILLCLPILFATCKKEENESNNDNQSNTENTIGFGISDSEVFQTTDGGYNWTKKAYRSFIDLDVISEDVIYGTTFYGNLFKSLNGGSNWDICETVYTFKDVDFITEDKGYAILSGNFIVDSVNEVLYNGDVIMKTYNSGLTWSFISALFDVNGIYIDFLENISFVTENIGYCSDNLSSIIYKTIDGGLTWNPIDQISNLRELVFVSEEIGYYNDNNFIYKTTNSGLTWAIIDNISFNDFDFISENVGFGSNSLGVWKTIDGGLTWDTTSIMNLNPITFINVLN